MIQEGLYAQLFDNSALGALCGGRIFEVVAPDDLAQYPCVAYVCVGGASEPSFTSSGVLRQRVEVSCFAVDYSVAAQMRAAVIAALDGWQQLLTDGTNVLEATILNPGTDFCSEQRIFRCMAEFYILYTLPG